MSPGRQGIALLVALLAATTASALQDVVCRVSYVSAGALYVDAGVDRNLRPGDVGEVRRDGERIAGVEVVSVSRSSARLRTLDGAAPLPGDTVHLRARVPAGPEPEPDPEPKADNGDFVPLLEKQKQQIKVGPKGNIFHGRVSLDQRFQGDSNGNLGYWMTLLGSSGSLDRIAGGPWALRWFAKASVREGDAFENSPLQGARLDVYEFFASRPLQGGNGFLRLGRLLPRGLAAAGYVDGAQAETLVGGRARVGGVLGFKPARDDLSPSFDQPSALAYATLESGTRGTSYYSGTFGALASWFTGDLDRAALLLDQFFQGGHDFRADLSAEIDFDVGASMVRSGTRLTRFNLDLAWDAAKPVTLRAGTDHYQRLDNRATRDALGIQLPAFDRGFWRYFGGATVRVHPRVRLDGELIFLDDPDDGLTTNWRAGVFWTDPFGVAGGSLSFNAYSVETGVGDSVGGVLNATFPLSGGRWLIAPSLGLRSLEQVDVTDVHLRAEYRASAQWSFRGSLSYFFGDSVDSALLDFGLVYRW